MTAELAGACAEGVGGLDFIGLFAAEGQRYLPIVDLVLGEIVKLIEAPTVHISLPELLVVFGFKHHGAPPVEDLKFVALDEVYASNDRFESIIDAVSVSIACRGEGVGHKHGDLVVDDQQVYCDVGTAKFVLDRECDLVFTGFVITVQRVGNKTPVAVAKGPIRGEGSVAFVGELKRGVLG